MLRMVRTKLNNLLNSPINQSEDNTERHTTSSRKRKLDVEEERFLPEKRKKLSVKQNSSNNIFVRINRNISNLFNYVVTGKTKDQDNSSDCDITEIMPMIKIHNTRKDTGRRRDFSRMGLSQISNATVLDLTSAESDDGEEIITPTKVVIDLTRKTSQCKMQSHSLTQHKSTSFLDKNVRLDERKRYRELLAQFTTVTLPEYSESISPITSHVKNKEIITISENAAISTSSWNSESKTKPILVDLTKTETKLSPPRRRFYHEFLHNSHNSTSSMEYTRLASISPSASKMNLSKTFLKTPSAFNCTFDDTFSIEKLEPENNENNSLLNFDWIKKWRQTLDPLQLERERQIQLEEKKKQTIKEHQNEEFKRLVDEQNKSKQFPVLTNEMLVTIKEALSPGKPNDVFVQGFNAEIRRADLLTLREATWLNDEVVNFYFNLIKQRSESESNLPKVHVFNTFFYPKIVKTGHQSVKRWTRKVDIFSYDFILIPIHLGMHWCLAVVDFRNKQLCYYDSLKGNNMQCITSLKKYLQDESIDKKKTPYDMSQWSELMPKDIPEQLNGCDCGVFMCKYAEYKSRGSQFTFSQKNMPYFRKRMIVEIINKKLL